MYNLNLGTAIEKYLLSKYMCAKAEVITGCSVAQQIPVYVQRPRWVDHWLTGSLEVQLRRSDTLF